MKVKDLKAPLVQQHVNISKCREKEDLIELIYRHFANPSNPYKRDTGPSSYNIQVSTVKLAQGTMCIKQLPF